MPHVIVKIWPGPSEAQKRMLSKKIVQDVIDAIDSADESISVDIVEVEPGDWKDEVYRPEIAPRLARLYKKPGYKM